QGARWMIEAGAMAGVSAMLGLHAYPNLPARTVGIRYGVLTAAADDLEIIIIGESGHGARPHEAIDAIWIAAQVVTTLQQAISRTQNPLHPVVLTIGQIGGGRAANVIADRVKLLGTVRSLHPDSRNHLPAWIEKIVAGVCQSYGARYEVHYRRGVPPVVNDPGLTELTARCASEALGNEVLQLIHEPSLGSEDFSLYLEHAPGTMFRLGVGFTDRATNYPLHHPKFEVNEAAIATGVITMAYSAYRYWHPPT
ncbi:MAG: amidohydrolase, partial [Nodosilinea sp.]